MAGPEFGASQNMEADAAKRERASAKHQTMKIRKFYTFAEDTLSEAGKPGDPRLRKYAVVAIVENTHAGRFVEDLKPMIDASQELGREMSKIAVQALAPYQAQSYGKGGIVGLAGEQEHINALLTTTFA